MVFFSLSPYVHSFIRCPIRSFIPYKRRLKIGATALQLFYVAFNFLVRFSSEFSLCFFQRFFRAHFSCTCIIIFESSSSSSSSLCVCVFTMLIHMTCLRFFVVRHIFVCSDFLGVLSMQSLLCRHIPFSLLLLLLYHNRALHIPIRAHKYKKTKCILVACLRGRACKQPYTSSYSNSLTDCYLHISLI